MSDKTARANVAQLRQTTQFTCCATSITSALHALGKKFTEDDVNKVLGAAPMAGATWEAMLATVQYFGCRGTLVVPATPRMLKEWTDQGIPVVIAWNPEGRPWSHASTVFDVTEGPDGKLTVHIMDSNIPNPDETTRVMDADTFCQKWGEKVSDTLIVRRPAMAVTLEVSQAGRQVVASAKSASAQRHCAMYLATNGKWYLELADKEYGERRDANTWGPFPSEKAVEKFLDNFSNTGGIDYYEEGKKPPPTRGPNGEPLKSPQSYNTGWGGSRWAARANDYSFTVLGSGKKSYLEVERDLPALLKREGWTRVEIHDEMRNEHEDPEPPTHKWASTPDGVPMSKQSMIQRVADAHEAKHDPVVVKRDDLPKNRLGPEFITTQRPGGPMHTRTKDVERGTGKPKHKKPWGDE